MQKENLQFEAMFMALFHAELGETLNEVPVSVERRFVLLVG